MTCKEDMSFKKISLYATERTLSMVPQKKMPRAGFEPTISSLLVTRLTNLAIKADSYLRNFALIIEPNILYFVFYCKLCQMKQ